MRKKISLIIACSVLSVLLITLSVFAFVSKSYSPEFTSPRYVTFTLASNKVETSTFHEINNKENYNKVIESLKESFEENFFTSLFSGRSDFNSKIWLDEPNATDSEIKNLFQNSGGIILKLSYDQSLELPKIMLDGDTFKHAYSNEELYYQEIVINVVNSDSFTLYEMYYINVKEVVTDEESGATEKEYNIYKQNFYANTYDLYNLLNKNLPSYTAE